ncbi:MAG: hypothetical protein ACI9MU_000724, partial [Alphaproteobacteria bacterium]
MNFIEPRSAIVPSTEDPIRPAADLERAIRASKILIVDDQKM